MWIALLSALLIAGPGGDEEPSSVRLEGRLVCEGRPVTTAIVGVEWVPHPLSGRPAPLYPLQLDREGRFRGEIEENAVRCGSPYVIAMDWSRGLGGWTRIDRKHLSKPLTIELHKLVDVSGRLDLDSIPVENPDLALSLAPKGAPALMPLTTRGASFVVPLPPGEYELSVWGLLIRDETYAFRVEAGRRRIELGELKVRPSWIAQMLGKPMPEWTVDHARGLPRGVRLKDLRGRWVLIELWNWSCGPCLVYSLPQLIDFYRDFAERRERFEIVALHCGGARNFDELADRLASRRGAVRLEDLPFPVLLDAEGRTMKQWGLTSFPTQLLIDPQGRLVRVKSGVMTLVFPPARSDDQRRTPSERWSRWPDRHPLGYLARRLLKSASTAPATSDNEP